MIGGMHTGAGNDWPKLVSMLSAPIANDETAPNADGHDDDSHWGPRAIQGTKALVERI
jgi:hypothetical protein